MERYFSSSQQSSIKEIVERAYVNSNEVTEYDRILESLLKERIAARRGSTVEYLHPARTGEENLARTIAEFAKPGLQTGHLQIIQGSVGSGKSLFMERYKRTLQPEEGRQKTKWATIDFNSAPVSLEGAEAWLCAKFFESFRDENPDIDFTSLSVVRGIYSRKIVLRKPIYTQIERSSPQEAELVKAKDLMEWQDNPEETARGIAEYVMGGRQESLVVVMDNVDRLDLKNQLAAFQLTLWFMRITRAFVIIQMRAETWRGTSNVFDASYPALNARTVNSVTVSGSAVHIKRTSSSDGNLCTYDGTIGSNGITITGTYTCPSGDTRPWKAMVNCGSAGPGTGPGSGGAGGVMPVAFAPTRERWRSWTNGWPALTHRPTSNQDGRCDTSLGAALLAGVLLTA